jgi:hypothetical protein
MSEEREKPTRPPDETTSFIGRWSRRKQEARQGRPEPETEAAASQGERPGEAAAPSKARPDEEPPVDLATLPKIEDLTATSDISVFLRKGVPDELKRLALRKAWTLDPAIRDFVEVAENQYNWNIPGGAPGYGPINEGTSIEALLAQATGRGPTTATPAVEQEIAGAAPAGRSTPASPQDVEPPKEAAAARDGDRSDHGEQTSEAGGEGSASEPDAFATAIDEESAEPLRDPAASPRARRRHGGALPV